MCCYSEPVVAGGTRGGSCSECQCCHLLWDISSRWCSSPTLRYTKNQHSSPVRTGLNVNVWYFGLGASAPALRDVAPAANGSGVLLSWSWPESKHWSPSGRELLHYVVEWTGYGLAAELQWKRLEKDQNSTSITGAERLSHSSWTCPHRETNELLGFDYDRTVASCGQLKNYNMFISHFHTHWGFYLHMFVLVKSKAAFLCQLYVRVFIFPVWFQVWLQVLDTIFHFMLWPPEVSVLHHPAWSTAKSRVRSDSVITNCPFVHFFTSWVYQG